MTTPNPAWIEAYTEAILDCMERENAKLGKFRGTFPREQYRSGIVPYATAALSVLTPLIEREVRLHNWVKVVLAVADPEPRTPHELFKSCWTVGRHIGRFINQRVDRLFYNREIVEVLRHAPLNYYFGRSI